MPRLSSPLFARSIAADIQRQAAIQSLAPICLENEKRQNADISGAVLQ